MKYISVKETSLRWGVHPTRISKLCREGRIDGARVSGGKWLIPETAQKPQDARTKEVRAQPKEDLFRFPMFVNSEEYSFFPPLSEEEALLCRAQKDFYACEFGRAEEVFRVLAEEAQDIHVQISARFFMCELSAVYDIDLDWSYYYSGLNLLLTEDFPHRKEAALHLPWLDYYCAQYDSASEKLNMGPAYDCHSSALYMWGWLSALHFYQDNLRILPLIKAETFDVLCRIMEQSGHFMEAQELHLMLLTVYHAAQDEKAMQYHIRSSLRIAYEHGLLFRAADMEPYYAQYFEELLSEFPEEFGTRLLCCSEQIFKTFLAFSEKNNLPNIYCKLSDVDYRYLKYAISGYTNKRTAATLKVSLRTVLNKYKEIYKKLGVSGKAELVKTLSPALFEKQK